MEFAIQCESFDRDLKAIERLPVGILEQSTMAINLCHNLLQILKSKVLQHGFENKMAEINFFKSIKQIPLMPLIYYSEIRSFELQFPKGNIDCQRKHVIKKINKVNRFFLQQLDFGQYIDSNQSHFDLQYYTREFFETYHLYTSNFYFQDHDFSTSRDMLLGKFNAYTQLVTYLNNRLYNLDPHVVTTEIPKIKAEKLIWPFSNTDWVELMYALSSAGMAQRNQIGIKKVSKRMEDVFDFSPKDLYKTYQNIKNRKNSRTLFLDALTTSLLSDMDSSEE